MRLDSDSNATLSIAPSRPRSGLYYGQIPIPDLTGIDRRLRSEPRSE